MNIDRVMSGSTMVGVVLTLTVLAIARANRSFLRDVARDPEAVWRGLARVAGSATMAMLVWITLFDQWRQLLDEPLRRAGQFPSERVVLDPTPDAIRNASLILLATSLLTTAPLIPRHVGGYIVQIVGCIGALAMALPLYTIRVRFDLGLAFGFGGNPSDPADIVGYAIYLLVTWALLVSVILLAYASLAFALALPFTLLLDLTRRREPRTSTEAEGFFSSISDRLTPPEEK